MPRRPPVVLAVALLLGTAGCTNAEPAPPAAPGPVAVPTPVASVTPAVATACLTLLDALPQEIDPGVARRVVEGPPSRFAAWGDPAVVLECGVAAGDPRDEPATVNGLAWTVRDTGDGFLWTTLSLGINVAVSIPGAYGNSAELVNPLAEPVLRTLPNGPAPS